MRSVRLNVSDGDNITASDVIKCSANTVYPPVSYHWQQYVNESWHQLQQQDNNDDYGDDSGSVLRFSTAGVYVLRCVARNVFRDSNFTASSGSVTLYVVERRGKFLNIIHIIYVVREWAVICEIVRVLLKNRLHQPAYR